MELVGEPGPLAAIEDRGSDLEGVGVRKSTAIERDSCCFLAAAREGGSFSLRSSFVSVALRFNNSGMMKGSITPWDMRDGSRGDGSSPLMSASIPGATTATGLGKSSSTCSALSDPELVLGCFRFDKPSVDVDAELVCVCREERWDDSEYREDSESVGSGWLRNDGDEA